MANVCPQCGAPAGPTDLQCRYCGERLAPQQMQQPMMQQPMMQQPMMQQQPMMMQQQPMMMQPQPQVIIQQAPPQQVVMTNINPMWPVKSKVTAGILAIFLGGLGIHKFYLGQGGMGVLYLLFCWTGIPELIGFIEGIIYLTSSDENFAIKNHCRVC